MDLKKNGLYLDYNATTPIATPVIEAINHALKDLWGNPSSIHGLGRAAKEGIEAARAKVASLINARPEEVFFTSGGTESNNTVILGAARAGSHEKRHIITTQIEHPSVLNPAIHLMEEGWDVSFIRVDSLGLVDPSDIKKALRPNTAMVSVMLANNETGAVQPLAEIAGIAHEYGVPVHTDAAQAVGKIPVDVQMLGVDYLTIAGHKLYAPKGIGALFVKDGAPFDQIIFGAGQEMGRRPGTEPTPLAVGLGAASVFVQDGLEDEMKRQSELRERLYDGILSLGRQIIRHGQVDKTLPNTLNISFVGLSGARILQTAPGLMASTGAACHAGSAVVSHVLSAMGVEKTVAMGAIRFSLGRFTTDREIDDAVFAIKEALNRLN
ncbi:cysteine desulfurase family protein [Dissulfurimicrobium hydrothermale]|nr:cysteine desulfurase family protein [Dissulfurimicrobium hydrothermale]UKL13580.1 cysteine desulfurase [Dissulfurimicrobium hydrothermale]